MSSELYNRLDFRIEKVSSPTIIKNKVLPVVEAPVRTHSWEAMSLPKFVSETLRLCNFVICLPSEDPIIHKQLFIVYFLSVFLSVRIFLLASSEEEHEIPLQSRDSTLR